MAKNCGCPPSPRDCLPCLNYPQRIEGTCDFDLSAENADLFACWNQEHTDATGTPVDYWVQDLQRTKLDPLYNEPELRIWTGPFSLKVFLEWPQKTFETREEGARALWESNMYIPRLSIEESNLPGFPREGDVTRIWQIPFFDQYAQGVDFNIPGAGYFFDVITVEEDGHPLDSYEFTRFKLTLKRRTEFTPERRVLNQT